MKPSTLACAALAVSLAASACAQSVAPTPDFTQPSAADPDAGDPDDATPSAESGAQSMSPEAASSSDDASSPYDASMPEDSGSWVDTQPPPIDAGPTCAPGLALCAGQCIDLTSDPLNCGSCGHSCGTMTCTMGGCDSIVLSTEFVPPGRLTIDSSNVYWTNGDGSIKSVPIAGGATATLESGAGAGMGIGVDTQNVYAVSQDGIISAPLSGTMAITVLATAQLQPYALAVDANNVYWSTVGSGAGNGTIMACAKAGCSQMPTTLASGMHVQYPYGLVVAGGNVYWTSFNFGGEINVVPTTGGTFTNFSSNLGYPYEISAAGSIMMVVLYGQGGVIATVPMSGGAASNIVGGQSFPTEGVTDGVSGYWTLTIPSNEMGATLVKSSLTSPSPVPLAVNVQPAGSVAVDGTWVYWLTNDGTVRKTAK
jgi:hypothetical protein